MSDARVTRGENNKPDGGIAGRSDEGVVILGMPGARSQFAHMSTNAFVRSFNVNKSVV